MLGVVIGIGSEWKKCAKRSAFLMHSNTGLECHVVSEWPNGRELANPSWLKLWLQDEFPGQDLMIFDADMIAIQPWNPVEQLGTYDMAWVSDRGPQSSAECLNRGLDPAKYGNGGLILIRAGCRILQQSRKYYPDRSAWFEQTAVNLTVQSGHDFQVRLMPDLYNFLVRRRHHSKAVAGDYAQAYNLHFVGLHNSSTRLKRLFKLQEHFGCS